MEDQGQRTAIYPGTFDPLTNGHVSLVKRGLVIFDRIIVGIAKDTGKNSLFTMEERVAMAEQVFADNPRVSVESYSGLTVEFAKQKGIRAILRGLRAVSDFEFEFQLTLMNRHLHRQVQTVFLMTDYRWLYISSTIIKQAASSGGDVSRLVPEAVFNALCVKYGFNPDNLELGPR